MGKVGVTALLVTVLAITATVFFAQYSPAHDRRPLFGSSEITGPDGEVICGYGYTRFQFDERTKTYEMAARGWCHQGCAVEWIELSVIRVEDWTGDDETSTWTTVARGPGTEVDGHWVAETEVVEVPGPVRGTRILYKCESKEPWGGWNVMPDPRNWIERARDTVFDVFR